MLQNIYHLFIPSFSADTGEKIGNFKGIANKLSYLKELKADAIWLSPLHPSPSYHKYDSTDYYSTDAAFGTIGELEQLILEAKKINISVLLDLPLAHTSTQHPWFIAAAAGSVEHQQLYRFMNEQQLVKLLRSQRPRQEGDGRKYWHRCGYKYYYSYFSPNMPALNYQHPQVQAEALKIARFWLAKGVSGFRLDAAKFFFPLQQMQKTLAWWRLYNHQLRKGFPQVQLIAEVWDDTDFISPFTSYLSCLNFPFGYKLLDALKHEKPSLLRDELLKQKQLTGLVNFNSNHDQTRIASALHQHLPKLKLAASVLLLLPGTAVVYYGEELGLLGEKPDPHLREPMPWNENEQLQWLQPKYNHLVPNVAQQLQQPGSLLRHYQQLLQFRQQHTDLLEGKLKLDVPQQEGLLAYEVQGKQQRYWVLHNFGSKLQSYTLPSEARGLLGAIPLAGKLSLGGWSSGVYLLE